jgi:hypothetical protein
VDLDVCVSGTVGASEGEGRTDNKIRARKCRKVVLWIERGWDRGFGGVRQSRAETWRGYVGRYHMARVVYSAR